MNYRITDTIKYDTLGMYVNRWNKISKKIIRFEHLWDDRIWYDEKLFGICSLAPSNALAARTKVCQPPYYYSLWRIDDSTSGITHKAVGTNNNRRILENRIRFFPLWFWMYNFHFVSFQFFVTPFQMTPLDLLLENHALGIYAYPLAS